MSTVNPPGSGSTPIPPSNEDEERNNQNNNDMNNQRPQTGFGERIKGKSLSERFGKGGGIKSVDGAGPSVRQVQSTSDDNGNASTADPNADDQS